MRLLGYLFMGVIALGGVVLFGGQAMAGGPQKVVVCHIPPGNPANFHTIIVGKAAVQAHMAHGDTKGEPCDFDGDGDNDDHWSMVTICHIPPGNPANAHTITVGAPATSAHLDHGDYLGTCGDDPPVIY
jgi:hypothetical protein